MNRRDAIRTAVASGLSLFAIDGLFRDEAGAAPPASTLVLDIDDPRFSALGIINGTVEIGNSIASGLQTVLPGGFPLALVRTTSTEISACAKQCPHNGCQVDKYNGAKFVCPCHGSEFTGTGARIGGPTPGPLESYPASLTGGILTVSGLPGDNSWVLTDVENPASPAVVVLHQNVPNPFTSETTIRYRLNVVSRVVIDVHDRAGRLVSRIVDERQNAGEHAVEFRPSTIPSGTYIVSLRAGSSVVRRSMVHVK